MEASIVGMSGLFTVLAVFMLLKFLPSKDVKSSLSSSATQSAYLVEDLILVARANLETSAIRAESEVIADFGGPEVYAQALVAHEAKIARLRAKRS